MFQNFKFIVLAIYFHNWKNCLGVALFAQFSPERFNMWSNLIQGQSVETNVMVAHVFNRRVNTSSLLHHLTFPRHLSRPFIGSLAEMTYS